MNIVIGAFVLVTGLFAVVLLVGAPYMPTLHAQTDEALDMLDLKPGDTLLELGSGDGRVLRAAAERGIMGIGYELNPLLVLISKIVLFKHRRTSKVYWRNYWRVTLPPADGVYLFLLERFMPRMHTKLQKELKQPTKVVSYAFAFPDAKPVRSHKALTLYTIPSFTDGQ